MEFLWFTTFLLVWSENFAREIAHSDVTYEELKNLDVSCNTLDNCKYRREIDTLSIHTCHCGFFCSQLDTCCVDSPFRGKPATGFMPSCRSVYGTQGTHYFLVDKCPTNTPKESIYANLCKKEDSEDLMSLVPVTSLSTNVTYKNYFCYRCHEREDKYLYWNMKLLTSSKSNEGRLENVALTYNKTGHAWMAPIGEEGDTVPVTFTLDIPSDISNVPKSCVLNVISTCPEKWQDEIVRHKCNAYTSIVHFSRGGRTFSYRSPHCAMCNSEDMDKMACSLNIFSRAPAKKPFSFTYLLDINRSDGDKVGKVQRCDDDSLWDPFFKKCRVLQCALPGYTVKDGKCSQ